MYCFHLSSLVALLLATSYPTDGSMGANAVALPGGVKPISRTGSQIYQGSTEVETSSEANTAPKVTKTYTAQELAEIKSQVKNSVKEITDTIERGLGLLATMKAQYETTNEKKFRHIKELERLVRPLLGEVKAVGAKREKTIPEFVGQRGASADEMQSYLTDVLKQDALQLLHWFIGKADAPVGASSKQEEAEFKKWSKKVNEFEIDEDAKWRPFELKYPKH